MGSKDNILSNKHRLLAMGELDWAVINARLPYKRTTEQYQIRKKMWGAIDVNDNGYVSLSEITRGVRDVLNLGDLFDCRPAINRAFHYSRSVSKSTKKQDDDYLEFREFRFFLQALRQFFEYYQAFSRLYSGQDGRVSKEEFLSEQLKETIEIVGFLPLMTMVIIPNISVGRTNR